VEKLKLLMSSVIFKERTPLLKYTEVAEEKSKEDDNAEFDVERPRRLLYLSHMFAKFAEQGWQFCIILFLAAITNYNSIIFVSTYGLFCGVTTLIFGSACGIFIDSKNNRLFIARFFIWFENLSIVIASFCCFFLLREIKCGNETSPGIASEEAVTYFSQFFREVGAPLNFKTWTLIIAIHIFGGIAKVLDAGFTVCMEKDWIVVMSKHHQSLCYEEEQSLDSKLSYESTGMDDHVIRELRERAWLSQTNTTMRQIDLAAKILAPAAAGIFISYFDSSDISSPRKGSHLANAALLVGMLNIISLYVEYWCSEAIYKLIPGLATRSIDENTAAVKVMPNSSDDETTGTTGTERIRSATRGWNIFGWSKTLTIYFGQPISLAGFSLSLLYLNVLSFGGIMTAYLVSRGMSFNTVGFWRGISSLIGLCGTVAFHLSESSMGLYTTAMWSIAMQFTCLSVCYSAVLIENLWLSTFLLIFGVCVSRVGLVSFDLATTQLMQHLIPEDIRGTVGGVQKSMESLFELSSYSLGLLFPNVKDFYILVITGYGAVTVAMFFYAFGVYLRQDNFKKI